MQPDSLPMTARLAGSWTNATKPALWTILCGAALLLATTTGAETLSECLSAVVQDVVDPSSQNYDLERQVANARISRRPAAIVFPTGPSQVADVILCARKHNGTVSVRSGAHSYEGPSPFVRGQAV